LTERVEQSVSVALLAAAIAGLAAFLWSWPPSGEPAEVATKGALSLAVLAVLVAVRLSPLRERLGASLAIHLLCAAAAVFAYYNFGRFHHPQFAHYWEQFHYQLGARYFPELGYDGLYVASIQAEQEIAPDRAPQRKVRDLRSNRVRLYSKIEGHAGEVRDRFDAERWRRFVSDSRHFVRAVQPADLEAMRRDHGYNPTPAWTFVARLFQGEGRLSAAKLRLLGALDSLLLAIAFAALFRTYGARVGCLCLVIFGLSYAGRFKWIGGAYLRYDWLAAVVLGVCALRRDRPASAGALFGYATAVRLFPLAFLFGPAVAAGAALLRGERPRWPLRFAAGFSAAIALALALGALTGRGPAAWTEFAERMQVYQLTMARNAVGIEWLVMYGGETLERAAQSVSEDGFWPLQREDVVRRKRERRAPLLAVQVLLLVLLGAAAWRAPPAQAVVLSMPALFIVTSSACYYWAVLLLAPLAFRWPAVAGLLALNTAMYGVHLLQGDKLVRYGLLSWGLAVLFLAWLLPEALRTLRRTPPRLGPEQA
jgi:hypothetical protein